MPKLFRINMKLNNTIRSFLFQNSLMLLIYTCSIRAETNSSSRELLFMDVSRSTVFCQKSTTADDLGRRFIMVEGDSYKKHFVSVEQHFHEWKFLSIDCELQPGIFNFSHKFPGINFVSQKSNQNPVLRNETFISLCDANKIDLSENGIKLIHSGAFHCVDSLDSLDLSYNELESLPVELFEDMHRLVSLYLNNNGIINLLEGTFDYLKSLRVLILGSNSIILLPKRIFYALPKLEELDLSSNKLKSLRPSTFSRLKNLKRLFLKRNNIESLKEKYFLNQSALMELDISQNSNIILSNYSFTGLENLELLRMNDCNITSLAVSGLFLQTPRLSKIYMRNNRLSAITSELFKPLRNVTLLDLSFNDINNLGNRSFEHNSKLKKLQLPSNKLTEIKSEDFRGLLSLRHLDISSNSLVKIAPNSFNDTRNLIILNINHNILSSVNGSHPVQYFLPSLANILGLFMKNSSSEPFKIIFSTNNKDLSYLDVSENPGLVLEINSFAFLLNLQDLYMHDCNLSYLPSVLLSKDSPPPASESDITWLLQDSEFLNDFNLSITDIELDNYIFFNNEHIIDIDLSGNKLTEIKNNTFRPCKTLRKLDLSRNFIGEIEIGSFDHLLHIEYLNLSHNFLLQLPYFSEIQGNTFLTFIDFSYNEISIVNWHAIMHVENVWLAHNKIKVLSVSDISATGIYVLHLEGNDIQIINFDLNTTESSQNTGFSIQIFLAKNPLMCDCGAFMLYRHFKENLHDLISINDDLECENPLELKGRKINNLTAKNFVCQVKEACPERCHCTYRAHDSTTTVNCSWGAFDKLPDYAPFNTSILLFGHNNLTSLKSLNESRWENLVEIHVESNQISSEEFYIPPKVKLLILDGNRMKTLPNTIRRHANASKNFEITLSNNSWPCDCSTLSFKTFLQEHGHKVKDLFNVRCMSVDSSVNDISLVLLKDQVLCPPDHTLTVQVLFLVIGIIILFVFLGIFLLRAYYRRE